MPVGKYASDRPHPYVTGVLTRTIRGTRFHGNVQYTLGAEPDRGYPIGGSAGFGSGSLSRWLTGIAADRAFAYRSLLVSAEVLAAGSMVDDAAVEWSAATGLRYQLTPTLILDGGVGRRLTGPAQAWYLTVGVARVSTLRFLFRGRGAWGRS